MITIRQRPTDDAAFEVATFRSEAQAIGYLGTLPSTATVVWSGEGTASPAKPAKVRLSLLGALAASIKAAEARRLTHPKRSSPA